MDKNILNSRCRNCGKPVRYSGLKPLPGGDEGENRRRVFYWKWHHPQQPPGKEHYCDPQPEERKHSARYAQPVDYCTVVPTGQYAGSICNKPSKVKVPEQPYAFLCGIHANVLRKEDERSEKWKQDWELSEYISKETKKLCDTLRDRFGVDARLHWDHVNHKNTGMIIVNPRELLSFLEEIFDG